MRPGIRAYEPASVHYLRPITGLAVPNVDTAPARYVFSGARTFLSAVVYVEDQRVNSGSPGRLSVAADRNVRAPLTYPANTTDGRGAVGWFQRRLKAVCLALRTVPQ